MSTRSAAKLPRNEHQGKRMSARTRPPFRADHVGSFNRPKELLKARDDLKAGRITAEQLRAVEDKAVRDIVKLQEDVGLQVVTDGEFRREYWYLDFMFAISGTARGDQKMKLPFRNASGPVQIEVPPFLVNDRLQYQDCIFGDHFSFLKSVATKAVPKITLPSPNMLQPRTPRSNISDKAYPNLDDYRRDIATVYQKELADLGRLGCTYVQLDDVRIALFLDPEQRAMLTEPGATTEKMLDHYVWLLNASMAKRPDDMTVAIHLCRGNYKAGWSGAGGYDMVAEALFGGVEADGFFLEYDDERSGGFEPLRFVPKGKIVVLGLVSSKTSKMETKDELKRRIDEAAKYCPLDQLALSPQCGFAPVVDGAAMSDEQQKAKLRLVVETAREVWG